MTKQEEQVQLPEVGTPEREAFENRLEAFKRDTYSFIVEQVETLEKKEATELMTSTALAALVSFSCMLLEGITTSEKDQVAAWGKLWGSAGAFPVRWNWEEMKVEYFPETKNLPKEFIKALLDGQDPKETEKWGEWSRGLMPFDVFSSTIFSVLTGNMVRYRDPNGEELYILEKTEDGEILGSLDEAQKEEFFFDKIRPFCLGGTAEIDRNGEPFYRVYLKDREELDERSRVFIPFLPRVTLEENQEKYIAFPLIVLWPLDVDSIEKDALFPLSIAFVSIPDTEAASIVVRADEEMNVQVYLSEEDMLEGRPPINKNPSKEGWTKEDKWSKDLFSFLVDALPKAILDSYIESLSRERKEEVQEGVRKAVQEVRLLLDAPTRTDASAQNVFHSSTLGKINLPRKISSIPKWETLEKEEVERIKKENKGAGLIKKSVRNQETGEYEERLFLAPKAKEALRAKHGAKWYREERDDADKIKREYIVKRIPVRGGGYIEPSLSWYNATWLLASEDVKAKEEELKESKSQPYLFDEMNEAERGRVENRLRFLSNIRDAKEIMDWLFKTFGARGENPLTVPAWELRSLLECERDPHGLARIEGCLRALQEVKFTLKVAGVPGESGKTFGAFLGDVTYIGRGLGSHGDGDFIITLSEGAVGCLKVFSKKVSIVNDPRKALQVYDFGKKLSKEEKKGIKYEKSFSTLGPFFDKAKGFTVYQKALREWIEQQITLRKDPTRKGAPHAKVKGSAPDANEPRRYDSRTCPCLPTGAWYHGALGHYKGGSAEHGRRLSGTSRGPTKTGGAHSSGLLEIMGYSLSSGPAKRQRAETVKKALSDFRLVVEEAFGGVVAGLKGGNWIRLSDAERLPPDIVLKEVTWCFFLPANWVDRLAETVERHHEARRQEKKLPYSVKITKDKGLKNKAEASRFSSPSLPPSSPEKPGGLEAEPLNLRLYAARKERGLTLKKLGELFGVSHPTILKWEAGPSSIPEDVAPLLIRWIETGEPPSQEDLAPLLARRMKKKEK